MALSFINTSGNIISEDFCHQLLIENKAEYVKSSSFGDDVKKIDEDIATSFELLRERWEEIRTKLLNDEFDNTQLRDKWIKPFLNLLGFEPTFNPHNLKNEAGIEYHIPYMGWDNAEAPLIHMVHNTTDFDARDTTNRTHKNKSPHDLLQQYLNTTPQSWAILINGKKIRILHDFFHSITKGFIEFDLEGIFESSNTEQFRILYRIAHSSRFINQYEKKDEEIKEVCWLEKFHALSVETGIKVGDNLRKQVHIAIETIGNGFAQNLNPDEFHEEEVKKFYSETLNIIYRLLFLLFAEQKGWLPVKNSTYARTYSINSLRERAEKADYLYDNNEDLWEGLKVTFKLVTKGYTFKSGEKINAFGGQLFSDDRVYHIKSPLKNKHLLKAIDSLCFFSDKNLKTKINYATLAIDELGSVYESLLDYEPRILKENTEINNKQYLRGEFVLDNRSTERKTSGSYYTDSRLVAQLIDSALVPVIKKAITEKTSIEAKRKALLELKVADIACGSGAFLTAALEKMGEFLALIGKEEGEKPTDKELRFAKREVLQNCIYGVDLNPMALELAKFSLWITASMPDLPLSFLDHKLKCGNSLIGATPQLIKEGIPAEAFNPVTLDDKAVCNDLKKRVRKELEGLATRDGGIQTGFDFRTGSTVENDEDSKQFEHILYSYQENADEVENIAHEYEEVYNAMRENTEWKLADTWTAAFFILKNDINKRYPTNITLRKIKQGEPIDEVLEKEILVLARKYNFFHWHLEFPEVFQKGGFDCILGNPPWEKMNLEDKEFFASRSPEISKIAKSNIRNKAILKLKETNPPLYLSYLTACDQTNKGLNFFKKSNYYKYGNGGLLNTYPLFTELVLYITNRNGTVGYIIPSGFFNDDTISPLFRYSSEKNFITQILDFENRKKFFSNIDSRVRFTLLSINKNNPRIGFSSKFFLQEITDIYDESKTLIFSYNDLNRFNPNNFVCPSFKNPYELEINKKVYNYGVLKDDSEENNTIHIHRMINMTSDSALLKLERGENDLPVYESKLFHQYDHRYANFDEADEDAINTGKTSITETSKKRDVEYSIKPRYFAQEKVTDKKNEKWKWKHDWYFAYRYISSSTNERTGIASIIPKSVVTNSAYLIFMDSVDDIILHLSNMNTFLFDFAVRAKVNVNFPPVILNQSPCISVNQISPNLFQHIKDLVISMVYTSHDLGNFAKDIGYNGKPFIWDDNNRFSIECELNAIFANIYCVNREQLDYILEDFSNVKRKDIEKYGNYRTKETILKLYDEMDWVKEEMNKTN